MSACVKSNKHRREPRSAQGNRLILGEDLRGTKSPLVTIPTVLPQPADAPGLHLDTPLKPHILPTFTCTYSARSNWIAMTT
jgi:hypothetical protein